MQTVQQQSFYFQLAEWIAIGLIIFMIFFIARRLLQNLQGQPTPAVVTSLSPESALLEEVSRMASASAEGDQSFEQVSIGPPVFSNAQQAGSERHQMLRQLQIVAKSRPEALAQIIQFWLAEDGNK
jgi:flagellar biosynthesis/type III secretory pathway M-ring protein FliF/YscJ